MRRTFFSSGFIGRLVIMALSATLAATLSVAAFTSTGAAQATKTENVEADFGKGLVNRGFPSKYQGVPLLKSFFFQYVRCAQHTSACFGQVDHHIAQILIQPNSNPPRANEIQLGFQDKNADAPYHYDVRHYLLDGFDAHFINEYDTGLQAARGSDTRLLDGPPEESIPQEFVLLGFQFKFSGADHHINEVGIIENNGRGSTVDPRVVTVDFNDQNANAPFQYRIWYAYMPRDMFSSLGERRGTRAKDYAQQDIPPGPAVIRGFRFDFKPYFTSGEDHHIKQIGVVNRGGRLQVGYADKNGDDGYDWRVKWGILK